jgi:plasmid stabilization system protein ParE
VSHQLIVRPAAEADIEGAYQWYEAQNAGLGAEFLRAVEASLGAIQRSPELYAPQYRQARRILLRRFPYAIWYIIPSEAVEVVGCFHLRRQEHRWRSRL